MKLNPNKMKREAILRAVQDNDGYCPCLIYRNEDTKCPCKEQRLQQKCRCGLYIKEDE